MELRDFIVPTKVGSGDSEVTNRIYLPSYEELEEKFNFASKDFIVKQEYDNKIPTLNTYWLRNDALTKIYSGSKAEGCVGVDGDQLPIRVMRDGVYCFEKIALKKTDIESVHDYFKNTIRMLRLCMRVDLAAYLALVEKYDNYLPYEYEDEHKKCHCMKIGKEFDIYTGKKTNKQISWRVLNWDDLPKSINLEGNGTATTIDLITLNTVGCSSFIENRNDLDQNHLYGNSVISEKLNGKKNKKFSFLDHAFKEEEILLRTIEKKETKKKTTLIIDTNSAYLKEDFIRSLRANPKVLNELVPAMKLLIQEAGKIK
ncbi:MAG: hypothetical protein IKT33_02190 [Clostridia bacterium]|nr:hypothetical protein [Clostridia bacterium]